MKLEVVTPTGVVFNRRIDRVTAPGSKGPLQILNNHANLLSNLEVGSLEIEYDNSKNFFTCNLGVLEVKKNHIVVITEASENYKNIDELRAKKAKDRAERRLKKREKGIDFDRAQIALKKALNRLRLSKK